MRIKTGSISNWPQFAAPGGIAPVVGGTNDG